MFFLISSLLISLNTSADVYTGPISAALGGGGIAGLSGPEGGLKNPALLPLSKGFDFAAYYKDGYADYGQHQTAYGVGAIDNAKDTLFPGSFHYLRTRETGVASGPVDGEIIHAAIAKHFVERVSIGFSLYRLVHDVESAGSYTQWNGSFGALVLVTENIGVGYVLNNPAKPGSNVPQTLRQDLNHGIGAYGMLTEIARARFDLKREEKFNPDHKLNYAISLETMTSPYVVLRVGFNRDELQDKKVWTAGFAFQGPRLKVDYAFEKNEERTSGAVHSVDLRVPF